MYIILVSNYKKKLVLFVTILAFWVLVFFGAGFIMDNSLIFSVTINNDLSFSYPIAFQVDNIYFNEQLENPVIETNSSIKRPVAQEFSNYKSLNGKFSFSYPSAFTLVPQEFSGSEILYHIDFHSKTRPLHGFVQVWSLPYALEEFLDKAKATAQSNFKNLKSQPVTVNGMGGYHWDYSVAGNDGTDYKGSEVFLQKNGKMYRISYFVPESLWNGEQSDIFWRMVNSFKTF